MSTMSRWLNWTPDSPRVMERSPKKEPTKPTKVIFDGFEVSPQRKIPIIRGGEPCPYHLPEGVKVIRFESKAPPVAVTVCSVVMDVPKYIGHALRELDARLHHPVQIRAGDSVFDILSKLADCGLELRLEWPPLAPIMESSPETEPSKPSIAPEPEPNAGEREITDEDIPF